MTLTLDIPPALEQRLNRAAERLGLPAEEYTLELLNRHLPSEDRQGRLIGLLQTWIDDDEDAEEQRETGEYLIRVLDEDRLSNRKLYPAELKGITW